MKVTKNELAKIIMNYVEDDETVLEVMIRDSYIRIDVLYESRCFKFITSKYFKYYEDIKMWLSEDVNVVRV